MAADKTIPGGSSKVQWTQAQIEDPAGTESQVPGSAPDISPDRFQKDARSAAEGDVQSFARRQAKKGSAWPGSLLSVFGAARGEQKQVIVRGPLSGYQLTQSARDAVASGEVTVDDVMTASARAGGAINTEVDEALKQALADDHLTPTELTGGGLAKALRALGLGLGGSVMSAMLKDSVLQVGKADPNDYRVFLSLLARAELPAGDARRITLGDGVRAELENRIRAFQDELLEEPRTSAFVESADGQMLVNQTAMRWAPVDSETFMSRLPPEFWAEDCHDLKGIHSHVQSREERPDGGYQMVMLQRMEFGSEPTATDMTKLTVIDRWKDDDGKWHGSARWKVFASDPTEQIDHAGSMRIDQGRMEFRPVERDRKAYTEVIFNNQTQTNTALEKKLFDWALAKDNKVRARLSAELAASDLMGIHHFAGGVVDRYTQIGSGQLPPRWPSLVETHVTGVTDGGKK